MRPADLKKFLEKAHRKLIREFEVHNDAIEPALSFSDRRDQEFVAFICSILAYGRVDQIKKSIHKLVDPLGKSPSSRLVQMSDADLWDLVFGWKHRFNTEDDVVLVLHWLRTVYRDFESLEKFLSPQKEWSAADLIENFVKKLTELPTGDFGPLPKKGSSFWFLLPRPSSGGACKRMNLFLRWMVGTSDADLSLWSSFDKSKLVIPLDTHVLKQSQRLRLTQRKSADWKTAQEITDALKKLDPKDPTRFDFAICHLGMKGFEF